MPKVHIIRDPKEKKREQDRTEIQRVMSDYFTELMRY